MVRLAIVTVLLGCLAAMAWAQTDRGSRRGREKDPASDAGAKQRAQVSGDKGQREAGSSESGPEENVEKVEKVVRTEQEWRELLTREEFRVLRKKGTERPYTNKYDKHFEPGTYACAACGQQLFSSDTKFNSGCGWPAFYASLAEDRVVFTPDYTLGMVRTEVTCARCDSHLGHIFPDAPQTPTGQRFCINSVCLKFIPAGQPDGSDGKRQEATRGDGQGDVRERRK